MKSVIYYQEASAASYNQMGRKDTRLLSEVKGLLPIRYIIRTASRAL